MSFVCLYVDNSNIFHEGQRFAEQNKGEARNDFRIYFRNFISLLVGGRPLKEAVWGGSIPPQDDTVWGYLRGLGIEPDLIPRSTTGENETVDHRIQLLMHRHTRKYRQSPGIIVLSTGDGKGYHEEEGFLFDVEGFVADGWGLEVYSWAHSCHGKLRQFAEQKGKFVPLDNYYEQISFIRNGRIVSRL
jgi:hypothetical protein